MSQEVRAMIEKRLAEIKHEAEVLQRALAVLNNQTNGATTTEINTGNARVLAKWDGAAKKRARRELKAASHGTKGQVTARLAEKYGRSPSTIRSVLRM
jgi:Holliday junction resolvasome RuvABC DNA-binding subunit